MITPRERAALKRKRILDDIHLSLATDAVYDKARSRQRAGLARSPRRHRCGGGTSCFPRGPSKKIAIRLSLDGLDRSYFERRGHWAGKRTGSPSHSPGRPSSHARPHCPLSRPVGEFPHASPRRLDRRAAGPGLGLELGHVGLARALDQQLLPHNGLDALCDGVNGFGHGHLNTG